MVTPGMPPGWRDVRRPPRRYTLAVVALALACGDSGTVGPLGGVSPRQPAPPLPSFPRPSVTGISPAVGSTGGGTHAVLRGTGFRAGPSFLQTQLVVMIGGIRTTGRTSSLDSSGATVYFETPAHAAGPVDVVVVNPDGQTATLAGGFTYAAPETFDFNGSWEGWHTADSTGAHLTLAFTIEDGKLTSVTCDGAVTLRPPNPPTVRQGAFTLSPDGGVVAASGRIVSASDAVGMLDFGRCVSMAWRATKQ